MRLAFLTLILGLVVGFAARSFMFEHPQWSASFLPAQGATPRATDLAHAEPRAPQQYQSPEKVLARLKQQFDEAVVVVLADESYDDHRKLVRVSVLEVWKGPPDLVGKTMDYRLGPPLEYAHSEKTERVLRFMPMTPHLDTGGSVFFTGDALRMNPTFTTSSLKAALVNAKAEKG